jgi:hypothetical protein
MSQIATQSVKLDGTKPTFAAAAAGDTAECSATALKLIVKNGAASSITVTVAVPGSTINGLAAPDTVYTVPATDEKWIPLYSYYADPSDTLAHITYSSTTTVTRAVVKG